MRFFLKAEVSRPSSYMNSKLMKRPKIINKTQIQYSTVYFLVSSAHKAQQKFLPKHVFYIFLVFKKMLFVVQWRSNLSFFVAYLIDVCKNSIFLRNISSLKASFLKRNIFEVLARWYKVSILLVKVRETSFSDSSQAKAILKGCKMQPSNKIHHQ